MVKGQWSTNDHNILFEKDNDAKLCICGIHDCRQWVYHVLCTVILLNLGILYTWKFSPLFSFGHFRPLKIGRI